jgi:hypothetical protein
MPGGRPSGEVVKLIDCIRRLVAEQRRLEGRGGGERLRSNRLEVARLQRRLAALVKRALSAGLR